MKRIDTLVSGPARRAMQEDRKIREAISRSVPKEWLAGLSFCRLDRDTLHLTVQNAGLITKLRFQQTAILSAMRAIDRPCETIRWHVLAADVSPATRFSQRDVPPMSRRTADHLRSTADSCGDEVLGETLRSLADRHQDH